MCLSVCFCVCVFAFLCGSDLFHEVYEHWKSWLDPDREFEKVPLLCKKLPTVQNIHGDWLAFAAGGMPQRLALYSNCVPKPVPFRSNLQNSKTDWPHGSSKKVFNVVELIIETLISKFLFLSVAMGWRIINPGTQVHSSVDLDLNLEVTNKHVESTRVGRM